MPVCSTAITLPQDHGKVILVKRRRTRLAHLLSPKRYVGRRNEIPPPAARRVEIEQAWENILDDDLAAHITNINLNIRYQGQQKGTNETAWDPELLLTGYRTGRSSTGRLELSPRIWFRCGSDWAQKIVQDEVGSLRWMASKGLGDRIEIGDLRAAGLAADGSIPIPKKLKLEDGFDLPDGFGLHLSVARSGLRYSACGLLCSVVITQGNVPKSHGVCKIGGILCIKDDSGIERLFGITAAHGLLDQFLTTNAHEPTGSPKKSATGPSESPRILRTPSLMRGTVKLLAGHKAPSGPPDVIYRPQLDDVEWDSVRRVYAINWLGGGWEEALQFQFPFRVSDPERLAPDADFALLELPSKYFNSYKTQSGVETLINGCLLENEISNDPVYIVLDAGTVIPATLIYEKPHLYLRGRRFPTRKIQMKQPLAAGNSGCWVVQNDKLCGMVVACYDLEPVGGQIEISLPGAPKIPTQLETDSVEIKSDSFQKSPSAPSLSIGVPSRPLDVNSSTVLAGPLSIIIDYEYKLLQHSAAYLDFKSELKDCTFTAVDGRSFVLVDRLTLWMKSESRSGNSHLSRLLAAAYPNLDQADYPITQEELSQPSDFKHLLIFCILVEIGSEELLMKFFKKREKSDANLPIDLRWLVSSLKEMGVEHHEQAAAKFDKTQWKYCPAILELNMRGSYLSNHIMPFSRKERINSKGGTASLWQIEIPEAFVGPKLREAVPWSRYREEKLGQCYFFALKTFQEGNAGLFDTEKNAYIALVKNEGMVRYFGEYRYEESQSSLEATSSRIGLTYNMILELGELDLDDYFAEVPPPVLQADIEDFWENMADIANALGSIHNLEENIHGRVEKYYGWHADTKPANILIVRGRFKLADPGFASFVRAQVSGPNTVARLAGGTETYGAPERDRAWEGLHLNLSQAVDIWSLGCVFSIAATWMVLGYEGIKQYRKLRERAIEKIVNKRSQFQKQDGIDLPRGHCFHNGVSVLKDVTDWHEMLRNSRRKNDTITVKVLHLVDKFMLVGNRHNRLSAAEVYLHLKKKLALSREEFRESVPKSIKKALEEVDIENVTESLSVQVSIPSGKTFTIVREQRKTRASRIRTAFKTLTRNADLESKARPTHPPDLRVDSTPLQINATLSSFHLVDKYRRGATTIETPSVLWKDTLSIQSIESQGSHSNTRPEPETSHRNHHLGPKPSFSNQPTAISPILRPKALAYPRTRTRNVFQAREELEERDKGNIFGKVSRKGRKDSLIEQYYVNRDIIFLVDNAETMMEHWAEAILLLETLLKKVSGLHGNGVDIVSTVGGIEFRNVTGTASVKKLMRSSEFRPRPGNKTDMAACVGQLFDRYTLEVIRSKPLEWQRQLTIIVLTDGIWGSSSSEKVKESIAVFAKEVNKIDQESSQQIAPSVQFIQFGKDPDATYRLRALDEDWEKFHGIRDIVDIEHSLGDVKKMLLGSFVPEFDLDEDESSRPSGISHFVGGMEPTLTDHTSISGPSKASGAPPVPDR